MKHLACVTREQMIRYLKTAPEGSQFTVLEQAPNGIAVYTTLETTDEGKNAVRAFNEVLNG